tara:strand:- start:498 stop:779 length:282 start_codon:yes stop_codon:yes gene_type:complete
MKYADRLLSLISSKTDIDPQSLRAEVITRFFESIDDEGSQFIDSILKFRDNSAVLAAIVIARLEEKVEEVIYEEESLEMTLKEEVAENRRISH